MTVPSLILVVDDDPAIRKSLQHELDASGYTTVSASDGLDGVRRFESQSPDLILTDLSMPRSDGFELISAIRAKGRTPIIVLSVRGDDADKIRALDLGADDFVTKPFSVAELLARVRAQLRRIAPAATTLRFHDLLIDLDHRRVRQGERDVHLTPTEYALLELLATHAGRPVFTDSLIARVWRNAPGTTTDTVRVHMSALRKKIEPDPSSPRYIVTEPWVGYRFIAEPEG
jgi:two-component system, OmpR family, KDP operon response regulator KdpE